MSKLDLPLTPEQRAVAVSEGWLLTTVFDNGSSKPYFMVVRCGDRFKTDRAAGHFVVSRARAMSKLHQEALSVVMASRMHSTPKRKK